MKSKLLLLLTLILLLNRYAAAQPTLNANPWWTAGDVFTNQNVYTSGVAPGSAGASQTWDFSAVTDSGSATNVYVVATTSTPPADQAYFPGATIAALYINGIDTNIEYFTQASGVAENDGGVSDSSHTIFTTALKQLVFPVHYGDSWGGPLAGTYTSRTFSGTIAGSDSAWADGWGTLKMPGRTYTDAMRIKSNWTQNISLTGGYNFTINYVAYDYMIPGYDFFIFEIATTTTTFMGHNTTITLALRAKNLPTGISNVVASDKFSLYPNPAQGSFSVNISEEELAGGASLQITDLAGKRVLEQRITAETQLVPTSALQPGAYVVNIGTASGTKSQKLMVQ